MEKGQTNGTSSKNEMEATLRNWKSSQELSRNQILMKSKEIE